MVLHRNHWELYNNFYQNISIKKSLPQTNEAGFLFFSGNKKTYSTTSFCMDLPSEVCTSTMYKP